MKVASFASHKARISPIAVGGIGEMSARQPYSIQLLHAYYPAAVTLHEHLRRTVDTVRSLDALLLHETDSKQYRDLLSTCIVASAPSNPHTALLKPSEPLGPLREVCGRR